MSEHEVIWIERRLSHERKIKAFAMRRGEAKIDNSLTPSLRDARREIEIAFIMRTQGLGYVTSDLERVRGQGTMSDEAMAYVQTLIERFHHWQDHCPRQWRQAVLAMILYTGKTMSEIAALEGVHRATFSHHFRLGLNEYCVQNGWGDQVR